MYERPFDPFAANLAVVKDYFRSGKVLALGIVRCISVAASVAFLFFLPSLTGELMRALARMLSETDAPDELISALSSYSAGNAFSSIASSMPSIALGVLAAVAFILLYAKSRSGDGSPRAGINILYVVSIIKLIAAIMVSVLLALALVILVLALFIVNADSSADPDTMAGVWIIFIVYAVTILITVAVTLFYSINCKRFFGSVKLSMNSVELRSGGAKPYGVMSIILGIMSALRVMTVPLVFIFSAEINRFYGVRFDMTALAIISAITAAVDAAAYILEGSVALGYKKHIDRTAYGYNQPAAAPAPYAPMAPVPVYTAPAINPYRAAAVENEAAQPEGSNPQENPYAALQQENPYAPSPQPAAAPICPHCGNPADPNAPFCAVCGNKLF